ncbi:MAG TPA: alpha/beta hydrolase-fold protein [Hymenobacter sp.]|jgi:enterochelin esterase-like enzyme/uncharacterized damage-inducible protein DinB|uniref:alpha/beta hydrolase-fold protein n=1 Tax=Hymenobacter sp. TaxID=1898978 RepID=UPI002ED78298
MLPDTFSVPASPAGTRLCREVLASNLLEREVELSILLPPSAIDTDRPLPVLYLNDGQDLERLNFQPMLDELYAQQLVRPFVVVAIHANERRVQEYGTAAHADFNGRGSLAGTYTSFLLEELLPFAQANYHVSSNPEDAVVAGFSLGGLTAFDVAWHHPEVFARAGVFSGSFWWRNRAVGAGYTPADRIMHGLVRAGQLHPSHRFWLQTGTLDEHNDRNENGVIDSIEDCLDLIDELVKAGLDAQQALRYVQVEGGRHHPDTWGRVMPDFLVWAFGQEGSVAALPAPLPVVRLQLDPALTPALVPTASAPAVTPAPEPLVLPSVPDAGDQATPSIPPFTATSAPSHMPIARPSEGDFLPYAAGYINQVPDGADPREALRAVGAEFHAIFDQLSEAQAEKSYAEGKWTLKEMLQHQIDTERIFAYRAMRFARGDSQNLPGFDQDQYVANSGANARPVASLLNEYDATRASTQALFDSFTEEQLDRRGTANGGPTSVRALLFIVPGHELHHLHLIRERYLPIL